MCEKLRKYMCFPMKLLNKTVQKPCEIFAKSLNEGSAANAVENPRSAMFFTCANFREKVLLQNALYFTNIINYSQFLLQIRVMSTLMRRVDNGLEMCRATMGWSFGRSTFAAHSKMTWRKNWTSLHCLPRFLCR